MMWVAVVDSIIQACVTLLRESFAGYLVAVVVDAGS